MTLPPKDAERALLARYGEPAKDPTDYVIGFRTPVGRVLAIHRTNQETRIWFQPPAPPQMDGITLLDEPNNGNSNINGPFAPLRKPDTQRVEVDSLTALYRFLDWHDDGTSSDTNEPSRLSGIDFPAAFARFQDLISQYDQPFTRFDEGLIAAWESYKPRVRDVALERLKADDWTQGQIGSGEIVAKVIDAIEIQASHGDVTNNMVFWQNRFGHANREHRALIEAAATGTGRTSLERLLFDLYRGGRQKSEIFKELSAATGAKYPLMAYLFFLKDMDRFMPIQPTGFDRVFAEIGLSFRTLTNCSWENYVEFNEILDALRQPIAEAAGLDDVRLIDAHSLLWIFSTLLRMEAKGELSNGAKSSKRYLGAREKSIAEIKHSVGKTVFNSNGQVVETKVKNKELHLSTEELDKLLRELLEVQAERCAITGLPLQFRGAHTDENMLPSLDRIDSDGHYSRDNLQIVCRFINFWKQASDDGEFRRLLNVVRGID
ncbi:hypothetical protein [uncultured Roseovarius sp.]|uniref:hypothetical protein n=1 Tax=uncultured Roseovarius sp. TaxID=293344 RepID=UPI002595CBA0|nr:hypothetical protein [uncultured Roseovarius sp.]